MLRSKAKGWTIALAVTVLGAAISGTSSAQAQIKVGITMSASGPGAALGQPQTKTVAALPKEIAGQKIEYFALDDESDPTKGAQNARKLIADRGAESCYWDYAPSFGRGPFRNVICLSVNDAVLHGLPHDYVLRDGDLLSMDIAVSIDGWVADSARSVIVGAPKAEDQHLIEATERALVAGIAAALPGSRLGDISAAIGAVATDYGYSVNTEFGGHGLGRTMHEDPHVPNYGDAGKGRRLSAGSAEFRIDYWIRPVLFTP